MTQQSYDSNMQSIIEGIGNTPLIPLNGFGGIRLYGKAEWYNPFGSLKDRPAYWMIREAEEQGLIKRGETIIIEPTSGNTGISLAGLCSSLGYKVKVVVPKRASSETKSLMVYLGAEVLETDDDLCPRVGPGTDQSIALAESIVKGSPEKHFMPNQYENDANYSAHYNTTGPEIWQQTKGKVTHVFAGYGTGGAITGTSDFLKTKNPNIKVIAIQPQKGHHLQGLRNIDESKMPELLIRGLDLIDGEITVNDAEAFHTVREAGLEHNLFLGPSSGATLNAALNYDFNGNNGFGVVILGDSGHKYGSVLANPDYYVFPDTKETVFTPEQFNELWRNAKYRPDTPFIRSLEAIIKKS